MKSIEEYIDSEYGTARLADEIENKDVEALFGLIREYNKSQMISINDDIFKEVADQVKISLTSTDFNMQGTIFEDSDGFTYTIDKNSIEELKNEFISKLVSHEKTKTP